MHDCDHAGSFINILFTSNTGSPFCLNEVGAYSTVNIALLSDSSFSNSSHNDLDLCFSGSKVVSCDDIDYPCFETLTDGFLTINFRGTVLVDVLRFLSRNYDYTIEWENIVS